MVSWKREALAVMAIGVTVLLLLLGGSYAQDTLFPAIITFGDSAVDVGNNNYLPTHFKANYPPYGRDFISHKPTGRFCNGKLVTDITAESLGFKKYAAAYLSPDASGKNLLLGANFGSAAAGFDNKASTRHGAIPLPQQLQYFKEYKRKLVKEAGGKTEAASIVKEALYILSAGTADFLQNYYVNPSVNTLYTPSQYSSYLLRHFSTFVQELYGMGARKVGVTSLPPLGCVPAARSLFGGDEDEEGCVRKINLHVQHFNHLLNSTSSLLSNQLPGLNLLVFNIYTPFYDLIQSPSNYGFVEARRGCCGTGREEGEVRMYLCNPKTTETICSNATQYVFWDGIHLSQAANQVLSDAMILQGFSLL